MRAAAVAAVVFVAGYAITTSLLWSIPLAVVAATGVFLMLDRRDTYPDEARAEAAATRRRLRAIVKRGARIADPVVRGDLDRAGRLVPDLLDRVTATAPDTLFSTAARLNGHLDSLDAVVTRYLDLQDRPELYADSGGLRAEGADAVRRFTAFALDSARLLHEGDLARYRAHVRTVAPREDEGETW